ncbi:MAG: hypothetical protein CME65_05190 [Halobacteriovoraceae bacterium]|nr:hypothetical protein [Halobacteriovoraceae bacterium]|tara:strand:- start:5530 stop:6681 length:1152 start_codon:yes stop_codon:yes gene_type:complete
MSFLEKTKSFSGYDQAKLNSLVIPNMKNEQWKYTNLERLYSTPWSPSSSQSPSERSKIDDLEILKINGASFSSEETIASIKVRKSTEQEIEMFLSREHFYSKGFLSQLINASPTLYLTTEQVGKNTPVEIQFSNSSEEQINIVLLGVVKDKQAISLRFTGKGQYHVHVWGNLKPNQCLEHVIYQELDHTSSFLFESHYNIPRDAHYRQILVQNGALFSRHNISASLTGENAETDLHGLYKPTEKSHVDNSAYIEHGASHTFSRQVYKGIIGDEAKGIFAGIVKVNKDCLLIEAEQLNKNLLLNKKAQAYSRPQMEIDADDVKCAHGSTIGQLSEAELFYFQSRGIPKERARAMLAEGFAMDVLLKIDNEVIRELTIKRLRGLC